MTLSKVSPELKLLYKNLQNRFDPYGMGKAQRLEWTAGLDIKKATEEQVDVLYWVGCVASLDDRNRKIARSVSTILQKAGVSFGVLGPDEKCCGDPLRRTGNEYQYQEMAQGNVESLKRTRRKEDRHRLPPLLQYVEERLCPARAATSRCTTTRNSSACSPRKGRYR